MVAYRTLITIWIEYLKENLKWQTVAFFWIAMGNEFAYTTAKKQLH